ncbi:MAG: hypothetical protein FXV80_06100 [Candidatus Thioglobus sp.]|nr:MAG: hypothetical protein FXV80_06100 [Candidatus Thioglobus sp.]
MKKILLALIVISLSQFAFASARMIIHLKENEITEKVIFQCEDLTACAERIQSRIESEGECDPRVVKVEFETVKIPGMDDEI